MLDPLLDHVLLVIVHKPVNVGVLATRGGCGRGRVTVHGAVYPRLAGLDLAVVFGTHQHGPGPALGDARSVYPPLFGPLLLALPPATTARRPARFRRPHRRRPGAVCAVRSAAADGRPAGGQQRPLRRRRRRPAVAGAADLLSEQLIQRMARPVLLRRSRHYRRQAGYVHGRVFAVRLLTRSHVDDRVRRLFAARRLHVARPDAAAAAATAVLHFHVAAVAGRPAATRHSNEL